LLIKSINCIECLAADTHVGGYAYENRGVAFKIIGRI